MAIHEGLIENGGGAWHELVGEDGRRLRVRFAIPGERVRAREREDDPGYADLVEVLAPSPARREPCCPRFGTCGGCQLLHESEASQLETRRRLVEAALERAGLARPEGGVTAASASPALAYRCRARFQAATDGEGSARLGFHEVSGARTVDVPRCPLLAPELEAAWSALREALTELRPEGLTGLDVTALPGSAGPLVLLNPRDRPPRPWPRLGEQLLERGLLAGVGVTGPGERDRPARLGATAALGRTPAGRPVAAALGGFVQAGLAGADRLCDELVRLGRPAGARVLELHAGAGLLSRALAEAGASVDAVEQHEASVAAARLLPPATAGRFHVRPGEAARAFDDAPRPDLLVTDPPRSGLGALARAVAERGPALLVGVWCSAEALERDAAALARSYRLEAATALDLFPQTRHVEAVCAFRRR